MAGNYGGLGELCVFGLPGSHKVADIQGNSQTWETLKNWWNRARIAEEIKREAQLRLVVKTEKWNGIKPRTHCSRDTLGQSLPHREARVARPTLGSPAWEPYVGEKKSCYTWQKKSMRIVSICISGIEVSWKSRCSPVGCMHKPNCLPQLAWSSAKAWHLWRCQRHMGKGWAVEFWCRD